MATTLPIFLVHVLITPSVKAPAAGPMGRWAAGPASVATEDEK